MPQSPFLAVLSPQVPKAATKTHSPKVGFVSLGCPKALVDSERVLSQLRAEGYEAAADYAGADVVVVNTCGFLDSARTESLEAIGEALAENGRVIVTGCLGAEANVIRDAHPKVLAITGPHQYEAVVTAVHAAVPPPHDPFVDLVPAQGVKLTPRHYAYLKISEGCNHRCSFCIIPRLRGDLNSRPAADVLGEAERLVRAGVRELLVISQDTSAYGVDLKYAPSSWRGRAIVARITDLAAARRARRVDSPALRVSVSARRRMIPLMADGKVLPYLDVPFQHAGPRSRRR
jgi:ribosomal protein S12 methylthiotransferase